MLLTISAEAIDYQIKDKFITLLTSKVEDIYAWIDEQKVTGLKPDTNSLLVKKFGESLGSIIKDRLGLKVILEPTLSEYYFAAIIPASSDYILRNTNVNEYSGNLNNSLTIGVGNRKLVEAIEKISKQRKLDASNAHNKKGWIDLKRARVGGYLSDINHFLIVNFVVIKEVIKLTPKEATAVILHEIGHAFTGLETHYKFTTTNIAISSVLNDLNKNRPDMAYRTYKRFFGPEDLVKAALSEDSDVVDFHPVLASKYMEALDSQFQSGKYDETTFEYMADNFSVRFGLGTDLVNALNKISLITGGVYSPTVQTYFTMYLVGILLAVIFLLPGGLIALYLLSLVLGINLLGQGLSDPHLTYDKLKDRYERVKLGIIDNLKDPTLPKEYVKSLVEQVETIDKVMNEYLFNESIVTILKDKLFPTARNNSYYLELQKDIERTLNNVLFVKAAKLRTL